MLKNYFKIALRKLSRNRLYATINVFGLAMGMMCCLFIFLIITYELRFDRFHSKADRIYRITTDEVINDATSYTMGAPMPLAQALRNDFPSLEKVTVMFYAQNALFSIKSETGEIKRFQENEGVVCIEPEFFEIFDFPWIAGDPKSLSDPNNIALTETLAKKFFGEVNPVGQTLRLDNQIDLKIVGVVKNFPVHTDLPFTAMISWKTLPQTGVNVQAWGNMLSNANTFVLLPENFSPDELQSKLRALRQKYEPDDSDENLYKLQPLSEIHFDGRYGNYSEHTISKSTLFGLGVIGIFLLITACINFINMATAEAINRAKEIGVRKVLGAFRSQVMSQFMGETFIITLLGALLALVFGELLLPVLNSVLRLKITLGIFDNLELLGFLAALILVVSLLAGLYPAFVLSRFAPALAIKNKMSKGFGGGLFLRRGLVVFQFFISQLLIIGTIIVTLQMDYFHNKDMGFDKDATVVVSLPDNDATKLQTFRTELLRSNLIRKVSFNYSSASSGNRWDASLMHNVRGTEEEFVSDLKFADTEYLSTYGLELIAGRNYVPSDTISEFVVNETFAKKLGVAPLDLIGKMIKLGSRRSYMPIVGVVKDFNSTSLHEEIRPCLLAARRTAYQEAGIKINMQGADEALRHIEKNWTATFPEFVYNYEFLDERVAGFYAEEQKMSQLFRAFSSIAIVIGCIGLFGLVSFMAAQRTKEIGVRKVLGATMRHILIIFSRELAVLIVAAFAIAVPIAYVIMNNWLENFAYRIEIGAPVFVLAFISSALIAALTVGYRAIKAATANPVESLRYE